jgi:hypothetical protein
MSVGPDVNPGVGICKGSRIPEKWYVSKTKVINISSLRDYYGWLEHLSRH